MWHGITYVEPTRRPVIHEGFGPAHIIVTNAGPGTVDLLVWNEPKVKEEPSFKMRMPPGNTRSAVGSMIAVALSEDLPGALPSGQPFAAVAWRMVR